MNVSGIINGGWLDHLWQMSWQAGVLVLLVLAVQTLLGSRLAARWRYALWFLVLARLLLPSLPESRTSIYRMPTLSPSAEQTARLSVEIAKKITGLHLDADADGGKSTLTVRAFDWRKWFTAGWLAGVVTLGGLTMWRQTRLIRRLRGMKPPADGDTADLLAACAREMKISKPPLMVETGLVSSPAVVGLWRPTLLLPVGLTAKFSREELRVVFLHELAHLRRGDLWVETLMMTLQILHWFNPLIWLGFWRMRRDRELATDALALAGERAGLKYLYGNTLIRLVENVPPPRRWQRVLGMTENAASLKSRLLRIKQMVAGAYGWSLLGVALLVIISVVALTQAPKSAKPPTDLMSGDDYTREYLAGTEITAEQAAALEKQVAADGENVAARAKLLGYYMRPRLSEPAARDAAQAHILWLIHSRPESQLAGSPTAQILKMTDEKHYAEAAAAWEQQIKKHPGNVRILNNAANYFLLSDTDRAEELWRKALELEPRNSTLAAQLAHLYQLKAMDGEEQAVKNLAISLEFNEQSLQGMNAEERFYQLPEVAMAAYRAGDLAKAEKYAREALTLTASFDNWNTGNAVYAGNHVLGLVALAKNDTAAAKKFLLLAGDSKGSPQLNSFGPNLLLAQKLLERGERETVLEFLDKIEKFWKMGRERITVWKQDIQAGKTAQLGNESY